MQGNLSLKSADTSIEGSLYRVDFPETQFQLLDNSYFFYILTLPKLKVKLFAWYTIAKRNVMRKLS